MTLNTQVGVKQNTPPDEIPKEKHQSKSSSRHVARAMLQGRGI
jgi:hypothetical protein